MLQDRTAVPEPWPLVSIVTPSLNMGAFLEETIRSVIEQEYPNVEYVVMDGGSTDNSLDILKRYEGRLRYVSRPDKGQADAVNRGFQLTRGSIFAFLNADDTYLPGAISAAVEALAGNPESGMVYGNAWRVTENGARISPYPIEPFDPNGLSRRCFICQPATFLRREVFERCGMLDPHLHFALDYDLWIRVVRQYSMTKIETFLATSRMHGDSKTMGQMDRAMHETIQVLQRHYGYVPYNWLYGYVHHRRTGQPLALQRPRPALPSALRSIALGTRYNWRHPLRYCRDILATAKEGLDWSNRS
jgi:glycosyltransferase involved in cell wall biosynthesis